MIWTAIGAGFFTAGGITLMIEGWTNRSNGWSNSSKLVYLIGAFFLGIGISLTALI